MENDKLLDAYKVTLYGSSYITMHLSDIISELECIDMNDIVTIIKVRISEVDFENLPEFDGF